MRIQILGGGNNQLNGIIRATQKGHEVVLTDYYNDAPGRKYAKYNETISTFDVEANIEVAKKYSVDGIMTLGTDQPVYTVARVATVLGLPKFLDINTAEGVTNKKLMKTIFTKHNIPTVKYKFVNKHFVEADCKDLKFPVVLKPIDSQGQRGVYRLNTVDAIKENISESLSFSRKEEALLEEFYDSDEITVSAWVIEGNSKILTITDRETFECDKHIGICFAHTFPSKYAYNKYLEIDMIIKNITHAFHIENGPLYVQLLVGEDGIFVNEVACRIGGAYEDIFIPYITGVDILGKVIDYSLGLNNSTSSLEEYNFLENHKHLSVQLFFAKAGKVHEFTPIEELMTFPGMLSAGYNILKGKVLPAIKDATARAGYMMVTGQNEYELSWNINNAFKQLKIVDMNGQNLVIQSKKY